MLEGTGGSDSDWVTRENVLPEPVNRIVISGHNGLAAHLELFPECWFTV